MEQAQLKMEIVLSAQFMDKLILKRACVNVKMGILEMVLYADRFKHQE